MNAAYHWKRQSVLRRYKLFEHAPNMTRALDKTERNLYISLANCYQASHFTYQSKHHANKTEPIIQIMAICVTCQTFPKISANTSHRNLTFTFQSQFFTCICFHANPYTSGLITGGNHSPTASSSPVTTLHGTDFWPFCGAFTSVTQNRTSEMTKKIHC